MAAAVTTAEGTLGLLYAPYLDRYSDRGAPRRGSRRRYLLRVYHMGLDLGGIVGPAVGGSVGELVGLQSMFQIVGAASLAAYFGVALATPQGRAALAIGWPRPARAG